MKTHDHEHPRWLPTVNRDYDPVLRRWNHPPPRWLWWYRPEPRHTKWDTIAGIVGGARCRGAAWAARYRRDHPPETAFDARTSPLAGLTDINPRDWT